MTTTAHGRLGVWDTLVGQTPRGRGAARRRRWPRDEPRVPLHRPAGLRALQRRGRVRRGAAVRGAAAGLRRLPLLPHRAGRHPRRRHRGPHRQALDRRRRGARPGTPFGAGAGRPALAGDDRRGRRPADRPGRQRAAQGDRGADRPHRVDAVRADRRGPPADDPLALPAGHPDHAVDRGGGRLPGPHRRRRARPRVVLRPRQPGPHRPGPRPRPRRGRPQPAQGGRLDPGPADQPRRPA